MRIAPLTIERCLGIDNVNRPERADKSRFQELLNVDITDVGSIHRRMGTALAYSGNAHSLMAYGSELLFVEGTSLLKLESDGTTTTIRSDLTSTRKMASLELDGKLYYSNGTDSGVYSLGATRSWGLSLPEPPLLVATTGDLLNGTYKLSITYKRSDGQESGASVPASIAITDGGIRVTVVASTDPDVSSMCIYCTSCDGEVLWRQATMSNEDASFTIGSGLLNSGAPLLTKNMVAPPSCEKIVFYRGRLYMSSGTTIWHTEPWNYELVSLDRNFVYFDSKVTMLEAVETGLWVGTRDKSFFLSGSDPMADGGFQLRTKTATGCINGASTVIDSFVMGREGIPGGKVAIWASRDGIFAGDGNGNLIDMTSNYFVPPDADEGWACFEKNPDVTRVLFGFKTTSGYGTSNINIT